MADCKFDRSAIEAWLDGESTAEQEAVVLEHLDACDVCRDEADQSSSALATFLALSPGGPPISIPEETPRAAIDDDGPPDESERAPVSPEAVTSPGTRGAIDDDGPPVPARPMPSVDFTDRVMRAIREEEERDARPAETAAPVPAMSPTPAPAAPAPILRPWSWTWAAAAGIAVAVFAGIQLMKNPVVVPPVGPGPIEDREVAVVDPRGGVMRWNGPVDRLLEGNTWVQPNGELLPGEVLHSTGNATPRVRLPEGGRVLAAPSSWLAYGVKSNVALMDGAITVFAPETGDVTMSVHTPLGLVATRGELEVSILTPDPKSEIALQWIGKWAAAWSDTLVGGDRGVPAGPQNVAALVFARKGPARIRMSKERGGLREIPEGRALVVLESGVFEVKAGSGDPTLDTEAGGSWMDGIPRAPDSKFGIGAAPAPGVDDDAPPVGPEVGGGPVRNTLERALADPDPETRARALVILQDLGGDESIALAAKMANDPSIMVRSAAMRVVALNSLDDLDAALPALRVFAGDADDGVATSAMRAIKLLGDTDSASTMSALVVDETKSPAIRAHAVMAAVDLGADVSVEVVASILPLLPPDDSSTKMYVSTSVEVMKKAPHELQLEYLRGASPNLRSLALSATRDTALAVERLQDPDDRVVVVALGLLTALEPPPDLTPLFQRASASQSLREALVRWGEARSRGRELRPVPEELEELALDAFRDGGTTSGARDAAAAFLFARKSPAFATLLESDLSDTQMRVVLGQRQCPISVVERAVMSGDPEARRLVGLRLNSLAFRPEEEAPTGRILAVIEQLGYEARQTLSNQATALRRLVQRRGSEVARDRLLERSRHPDPAVRRTFATFGPFLLNEDGYAEAVVALMDDPDPEIARITAQSVMSRSLNGRWTGPALETLWPPASSDPVTRGRMAIAAAALDLPGAADEFYGILQSTPSAVRALLLQDILRGNHRFADLPEVMEQDPSPTVRVLLIVTSTSDAQRERAERLRRDAVPLVRMTALAYLASSGEAMQDELVEALEAAKRAEADAFPYLRNYTADTPGLDRSLRMMGGLIARSRAAQNYVEAGSQALARRLRREEARRRVAFARATLLSTGQEELKTQEGVLSDLGITECLDLLRTRQTDGRDGEDAVASDIAESLAGFRPAEPLVEFLKRHRYGLALEDELPLKR